MDKYKLFEVCKELITDKKHHIDVSIKECNDALINETKSSAGDKYETSREMLQQDLTRLQQQLKNVERERIILNNVSDELESGEGQENKIIKRGSIVKTDQHYYFLGVGLGLIDCDGIRVYAVSLNSPFAKEMYGKKVGDKIIFNKKIDIVENIY